MKTESIKKTVENGVSTVNMSAPWYALQRKLSYTIGQSGQVIVSQLDTGHYQIVVTALFEDTAKALASTLKLNHEMGNISVNIIVMDMKGNTWVPNAREQRSTFLMEDLKTALVNNPFVYEIQEFNSQAAICCTSAVVQYYNDDISNPYSFTSMLAADAFKAVFRDEIAVYTLGKGVGNF